MKPKYTKQQIEQLNTMNRGAFITSGTGKGFLLNNQATSKPLSLPKTHGHVYNEEKPKIKTILEIFYDNIGNFIHGGKSIAPAELKGF